MIDSDPDDDDARGNATPRPNHAGEVRPTPTLITTTTPHPSTPRRRHGSGPYARDERPSPPKMPRPPTATASSCSVGGDSAQRGARHDLC